MENIFKGIFDAESAAVITIGDFLICMGASLVLGIIIALAYAFRSRYTKSFVTTLAMLPCIVCVVIMMVNGNIGAGVAVAGAFSLVRFRSVPGTAKEIGMIFLAMGTGLIAGMGYIGYAVLFTLISCAVLLIYNQFDLGFRKNTEIYKTMSVTIPEDLNYSGLLDEVLKEYTRSYEMVRVKTTNCGSMFKLTYNLVMRDPTLEKEFIDKLRQRNGNLEISLSKQESVESQL